MIVTFFFCYILLLSYSLLPLSLSPSASPPCFPLSLCRQKPEVILRLFDRQTNTEKFCHLRDDWYVSPLPPTHTHTPNTPPSHSHTHTPNTPPPTHSHTLTCRLQTDVSPGDVVQVNAPFDTARGGCVIDNGRGSLIVDPDQLISGTTVANSITCVRRCV